MAKELDSIKMWESILIQIDKSPYYTVLACQIHNALKDQGFKFDGEHIVPIKECKGNNGGISHNLKEGDWIVDSTDRRREPMQIKNILTVGYTTEQGSFIDFKEENNFHLWSIDDAKDGDVLVHSSFMFDDFVFIYNSTSILQAYCYYSNEKKRFIIEDKGHYCPWNMQEVKPATKEQRDTLFAKMKEAGYEWDAEKKELKKKSTEEYNITGIGSKHAQGKLGEMIKNLKSTWSEEDETIKNNISHIIEQYDKISKKENQPCWYIGDCLLWMQNIKNRVQPQPTWKPSDEQMEALETAIRFGEEDSLGILALLYNDSKKLRMK